MRTSASAGLVVGLGNPGRKYSRTRHNIGFSVLQALITPSTPTKDLGSVRRVTPEKNPGYELFAWDIPTDPQSWFVCRPLTFMNRSGRAVHTLCMKYHFQPRQLLVVHDDLDLPLGTLRFKYSGGLAGHNGLKSIVNELGTRDFYRLRVGIGRPAPGVAVVDHVLAPFENFETPILLDILSFALQGIFIFRCQGFQKAVDTLHSHVLT